MFTKVEGAVEKPIALSQIPSREEALAFLTFKGTHWYYRENKKWVIYDKTESDAIEKAFTSCQGIGHVQIEHAGKHYNIHFDKMKSTLQGANKAKHITRGAWFYQDEDGEWQPFMSDVAAKLEFNFQKLQAMGGSDGHFPKVDVTKNPRRYVEAVPGSNLTQFRQIRESENANKGGRPVRRGA